MNRVKNDVIKAMGAFWWRGGQKLPGTCGALLGGVAFISSEPVQPGHFLLKKTSQYVAVSYKLTKQNLCSTLIWQCQFLPHIAWVKLG